MEKRAIKQSANALLPGAGFATENLLAPRQAIVAFFSCVTVETPSVERVPLGAAFGRVLACRIDADGDYPNAARSAMDGFALMAASAPGAFEIIGDVGMGRPPEQIIAAAGAMRIPTGGVMPEGADAVVPIEDARVDGARVYVAAGVDSGENVIPQAADMRRGEPVLHPGRRIGAPQVGVLATLGVTQVPVYRRPVIGVLSSGDELVAASAQPAIGQVRDSNRYAIAASLHAMGALPRHYPLVLDEAAAFAGALTTALDECDAIVMTGGSSVGERDRLPGAVASLGAPGVVVHGLRVKPGKPALFGARGGKPIVGLPGNPTSALLVLEAIAAPIVAALTGAPIAAPTTVARLAEPVRSRAGSTWYVPVALRNDGATPVAQPLPLRSFSVSLTARADGYVIADEGDEALPGGAIVTVHRFLGGS